MKRSSLITFCLLLMMAACAPESEENTFMIGEAAAIDGLHDPWDHLDDSTVFRCYVDDEHFRFLFEVEDETITVMDSLEQETDMDFEDRAEIYFSPSQDMKLYWCAEMDPSGNIMDYSCRYYRDIDYTWNFKTLEIVSALTDTGYTVIGKVDLEELQELGINLSEDFYMGVFRADFKQDGSVNWYSHVMSDDEVPDFHKPDMLFKARILR